MEKNESVNVYVNIPSEKLVKKRYDNVRFFCDRLNEWINDYSGKFANGYEYFFPTYVNAGKYSYNQFTKIRYVIALEDYEKFLDLPEEMSYVDNFKRIVFSWLEKEYQIPCENKIAKDGLSGKQREQIMAIINANYNRTLSESEQKEIVQKVLQIKDPRKDKRTGREGGTRGLNNVIALVGYKMKKEKGNYIITKIDVDTEGRTSL